MTSVFENKQQFGYNKLKDKDAKAYVKKNKKSKVDTDFEIKDLGVYLKNSRCPVPSIIDESEHKKKLLLDFIKDVTIDYFADFSIKDVNSVNELMASFVSDTWDKFPEFLKDYYEYDKELLISKTLKNDDDSIGIMLWRIYKFVIDNMDKDDKTHTILIWGSTGGGKTSLFKIVGTVFNPFNPNDEKFANYKINDHEVGTKEVSEDPIEVFIGNMKLILTDVPGTNDEDKTRDENEIMKQIKESKAEVDALIYNLDVSDSRQMSKASDKWTLENLAYGFKNEGVKLWKKVIVVLSKANKFSDDRFSEPEYDDDLQSDEYDKQFFKIYEEWIINHNKKLNERINIVKEKFKKNFTELFNKRDLYPETSKAEIEEIFSNIQFVTAGYVKIQEEFREITDTNHNEFQQCEILPVPNFKTIKRLGGNTPEKLELERKIKDREFVKVNNWVSDLVNSVILCSSNDFKLKCYNAYTNYSKSKEHSKNEDDKMKDRIDNGINLKPKAKKEVGRAAREVIERIDASEKGFWGYLGSTAGGAVVGTVVGGAIVATAGAAAVVIGIGAGLGAICGCGWYHTS